MGLFSKKKKTRYDGTIVMFAVVLSTLNREYALKVKEHTQAECPKLIERHFLQLIEDHYLEECRPPRKVNNYFTVIPVPEFPAEVVQQIKFWDDSTLRLNDRGNFNQFCSDLRDLWKQRLTSEFPKFNRSKLEDGFENVNYDYYPDEGVVMLSMFLTEPLPV